MAVFAVPSDNVFRTDKELKRKRVLTAEQREFMEFVKTHNISLSIDKENGEVKSEIIRTDNEHE